MTVYHYMVSGFRFQVSGFRFQVSGFRFQVSGFRFQVSSDFISPWSIAETLVTSLISLFDSWLSINSILFAMYNWVLSSAAEPRAI